MALMADVIGHGLRSTRWYGRRGILYILGLFIWKINVLSSDTKDIKRC